MVYWMQCKSSVLRYDHLEIYFLNKFIKRHLGNLEFLFAIETLETASLYKTTAINEKDLIYKKWVEAFKKESKNDQ